MRRAQRSTLMVTVQLLAVVFIAASYLAYGGWHLGGEVRNVFWKKER